VDADVGVVQQPVDGGGRQGLRHDLVEACRVQVGGGSEGAFLVAASTSRYKPSAASSPMESMPMSSTIALLIESPARCLRRERRGPQCRTGDGAIGVDGVLASASQKWLFPVPLGPPTHRVSCRSTHAKVRSAC
jgi:hypothetical protein